MSLHICITKPIFNFEPDSIDQVTVAENSQLFSQYTTSKHIIFPHTGATHRIYTNVLFYSYRYFCFLNQTRTISPHPCGLSCVKKQKPHNLSLQQFFSPHQQLAKARCSTCIFFSNSFMHIVTQNFLYFIARLQFTEFRIRISKLNAGALAFIISQVTFQSYCSL